jgi:uncharacterized protein (TIGR02271 family)
MAYTRSSVVGVFENHSQAQRAVDDLRRAGFREDQIGVATQDRSRTGADDTADDGTNAGTGAVTGALAGAGLGAAWGIGILAGLLPAIGPVIAGGTLAAILASAGLGAAAAGIAGLLIGMGIPEEEANYYESEFKAGRTIVTVKAENRYDEAVTIIRRHNGHAQDRTGDFQRATFAHTSNVGTTRTTGEQKVQLREEELQVHKTPVQTGEVRVGKEVITEHKTIQVPVQREEVVIERHPASGQPTSGGIRAGEEVRIPVKEEEVHVDKVTVAKEDVTVGKRTVQGTETVSGDVRKEQVKIEEEGDVNVKNKRKDKK